ncbi:MAG TPA: FAD-dependent oxidoreductase [Candidatus Acidoferrales bacterium]|nr:FAD-dependent oxidoreductase [Candidatus Acidoferrales bacterium]
MHSPPKTHNWGNPPWQIDFAPSLESTPLPEILDFAVIGGGFTGLAAAAWLRKIAPEKSVAVLEAWKIGNGASGRTGGMALAESAAGDLPGLGDVLAGFSGILDELGVECDRSLNGAWEVGREESLANSPISWNDSGSLCVSKEVPGGTIDPGRLVGGLAQAADRLGAHILENHPVADIRWSDVPEIALAPGAAQRKKLSARKILFATNALSLELSGMEKGSHPRLTLAVATEPVGEETLEKIGLALRKPFYTVDMPYLWGRVRKDDSIIFGAGLVQSPDSDDLDGVDISAEEPSRIFTTLEDRVRRLHPALKSARFTHRWGGPIMFRDSWKPVFTWHPEAVKMKNAIMIGAFAGHGVALSSYLGCWAAEALLGRRELPRWGKLED